MAEMVDATDLRCLSFVR